eukprot:SAG25_NODE_209_length_11844_cov_3.436782_3_plen_66_part_00
MLAADCFAAASRSAASRSADWMLLPPPRAVGPYPSRPPSPALSPRQQRYVTTATRQLAPKNPRME